MATKKYVSLEKLTKYDELLKAKMAADDAAALASAKAYADGLAGNYEAAGSVATAQAALQKNIDAVQVNVDAAAAAAATAQSEVDALETLVGTLPSGTAATSVVDYVNLKTSGIATDAALGELNNQVTGLQTVVNGITADYLKAADKTELANAIAAEENRAKGVESGLETRLKAVEDDYLKAADAEALQADIDAIEADYLKAADKTELANAIALKADKTALDAVSAVANAAATQTALQGEIDRAKGEEARIEGLVTAEAERAAQAEAGLQTQINTIMNNPDTEGVINSINEFTQYIADHGEIADGFRADIDANKKAIEDHEALAAQTYETKEDATSKYDELAALVGEKAIQADWNQNDPEAADYIKNRPFYEVESVVDKVFVDETVSGTYDAEFNKYNCADVVIDERFTTGETYEIILDGKVYYDVAKSNYYEYVGAKSNVYEGEYPFSIYTVHTGSDTVLRISLAEEGSHTIKISHVVSAGTLVQLDEKFIPDTIARVTDVDALKTELEGKINAKADSSALTSAVEALEAADDGIIERVAAVEALMGDGEGSVADQIADAMAETIEEAAAVADEKDAEILAQAKADASNKDAVVLAEAQKASTAVQTALDTHTGNANIHVTAEQKTAWTTAAGKAHEHTNLTVLEGVTADKVAAWDKVSTKADQTALQAEIDRATAAEAANAAAIAAFVEVSEEEINALFA